MPDSNQSMSEFRPPDSKMIDYMLELSGDIEKLSNLDELNHSQKATLEVASRSIKLLLAMAISGHTLFIAEGRRLDAMADLARTLHDILLLTEPSALDSVANLDVLRDYSQWEDDLSNDAGLAE